MAELEAIQTAVTQVVIQVATVAVMMLRKADAGPTSGTSTANVGQACRYRHNRPVLQ